MEDLAVMKRGLRWKVWGHGSMQVVTEKNCFTL